MTEKQDPNITRKKPQDTPKQNPVLEAKRAQNLRDNLLRRKQQARARSESQTDSPED